MYKNHRFAISLIVLVFAITTACKTAPSGPQSEPILQEENMPDEQKMRLAMQAYIDHFNAKDNQALADLFTAHARIEDPVGGGKFVEGRAQIDEFYQGAVKVVDRLELAAPIRTSRSNAAAMAFDIHMKIDGRPIIIRAIDVMTFDTNAKIIDMKAYHGPGDLQPAPDKTHQQAD